MKQMTNEILFYHLFWKKKTTSGIATEYRVKLLLID